MGTFVANGLGTTGMLYRRNRYFNPNGGQFTQADPLGIAGGMNAFGFAEGDPVNFSDPYGLWLCPVLCAAGPGALAAEGAGEELVPGLGQVVGTLSIAAAAVWAGYEVWASVSDKRHKIALQGQADNIAAHFSALNNPNEPGGNDPKWRDKWKRDIQKGLRIMKDRLERLKSDKAKEDWARKISDIDEQLSKTK
jgi:RHS repeat-associated protein